MKFQIERRFEKDCMHLPRDIQNKLNSILLKVKKCNSLYELGAEKLVGYDNAYRLRIGNYRVGLYKEGDTIILSRVLNRKEIYRYFPKK